MGMRAFLRGSMKLALVSLALCTPALAQQQENVQTYPSKPIRLIVPFAAGGGTDLTARAIAQKPTEAWGQPVIVDNRPGANGTIGVDMAAKAATDGYTLTMISSTHSVNVSVYKN